MSKPKHRVFCVDCQRQKMVFETEKEALLFIKYNSEDMESHGHQSPTRAYYCPTCCAWHVTKKPKSDKVVMSMGERILNAERKDIARQKVLEEENRQNCARYDRIYHELYVEYREIVSLLPHCPEERMRGFIGKVDNLDFGFRNHGKKRMKKVNDMRSYIASRMPTETEKIYNDNNG